MEQLSLSPAWHDIRCLYWWLLYLELFIMHIESSVSPGYFNSLQIYEPLLRSARCLEWWGKLSQVCVCVKSENRPNHKKLKALHKDICTVYIISKSFWLREFARWLNVNLWGKTYIYTWNITDEWVIFSSCPLPFHTSNFSRSITHLGPQTWPGTSTFRHHGPFLI